MTRKLTLHMSVYIVCMFLQVHVHASSSDVQDLTSFGTVSFKDCFDECKKRTSCVSLTYKRRATFCRLFNQPLVDYSHTRTAGLLYRDSGGWPELGQQKICEDGIECEDGETCDGACAVLECPVPQTDYHGQYGGNLRNIGSKTKYTCNTGDPATTIWTCAPNGTWTGLNIACRIYGYSLARRDGVYRNYNQSFEKKTYFTLNTKNLAECLKTCNQTTNCLFINFFASNNTCWSPYLERFWVEYNPGWIAYSKTRISLLRSSASED